MVNTNLTMVTIADLFPPGTDLCQLPSGAPPNGQLSNFSDPGLKSVIITISVILTTIATTFGLGRLFINLKRLTWTDLFVLLAMACNIAHAVLIIINVKYFRHSWDVPLCLINGQLQVIVFVWGILLNFSPFFSKTATLILFRQIFATSRAMDIAIWVGVIVCFATSASGLVIESYYAAPHIGDTWDNLAAKTISGPLPSMYWSVVQGAIGTVLDVYIFILPLTVLIRLNLSMTKKIQIIAIFFVGVLGVAASIASLVYRVKTIQTPLYEPLSDGTYVAGILLLTNLAEVDVALIICSAPAFAIFVRVYVLDSWTFKYLREKLGGNPNWADARHKLQDPNQPRTGRRDPLNRPFAVRLNNRFETSDTWLFKSEMTVDIEASTSTPTVANGNSTGDLSLIKIVDVECTRTLSTP
ncbi:hypothetical protein F5Y09DRAFT_241116 [Xylaria sp. FL1042]|nr:hypothetical protein F5Y09DRAFT_241116 [Xylaria sp. FL1042]